MVIHRTICAVIAVLSVSSMASAENWMPVGTSGREIDVDSYYMSRTDGSAMANFRMVAGDNKSSALLIFNCKGQVMVPVLSLEFASVDPTSVMSTFQWLLCEGGKIGQR